VTNGTLWRRARLTRRTLLKHSAAAFGAASLGALLAACGDDDDDDDVGTNPTATSPGSAATTPAGAATATSGGGAGGDEHAIEANDEFKFVPAELTIKVGDTVLWKFVGTMPHSVTFDPSKAADAEHVKLPAGVAPFDSGILNAGAEYEHTFDVAGDYEYICIPHEALGMLGKITVEA
jgi:plastocyanin